MRDTSKVIPGLRKEDEESGRYHRIQADLTKEDTLRAAVENSGATRAFVYHAGRSSDHMKSCFAALKTAGITFVVFLSSYSVGSGPWYGDLTAISQEAVIPYMHAQAELSLEAAFGPDSYVAIRPGAFATNVVRQKAGMQKGEVRMGGTEIQFDLITDGDMGRVSGTVLATQEAPRDGQRHVYLYGPKIWTQRAAIESAAKILGIKDVKVVEVDEAEARETFMKAGIPVYFAEYLVKAARNIDTVEHTRPGFDEGVRNVMSYTGRESMGWEAWVEQNKARFAV